MHAQLQRMPPGQQLRETRDALLSTDAETPLALFDSYEALAAEFPPLPLVVEALVIERRELEASLQRVVMKAGEGALLPAGGVVPLVTAVPPDVVEEWEK